MDARVDARFIQGLLDIKTGRFEKWGEESVCVNHGQINPVNGQCFYYCSSGAEYGVISYDLATGLQRRGRPRPCRPRHDDERPALFHLRQ